MSSGMAGDPRVQQQSDAGVLRAWGVARLSIELILDVAKISRGQGDLVDPLLLTAILEANQAGLRHEPQLMKLYADAQSALPDHLRRPISINALAKSLRLPFETVRRRLRAFADAGLCVRTVAGVYVPHAVVTSPSYIALQAARVARLAVFQSDLARMQMGRAPADHPGARPVTPDVRAADRALAEYMLRASDCLIELADGPMNGFVLLGLCAVNLEGLRHSGLVTEIGDAVRSASACSVTPISARLGAPAETVRRRLLALQARGLAERCAQGWIAAAPPSRRDHVARVVSDNEMNLRRLCSRMQSLSPPRA
jgi:DNA-binding Lrp family transcriptional regulator